MKNKKIVVCLLIAVMVLGFTLTALVGCSGYKNIKSDKLDDHLDFLATAVANTAKDKNLNNLNMGASLTIETNSGKSKKNYSIDLAAGLALSEKSAGGNKATLEIKDITDKKNSKNIISAYYYEETSSNVYLKLGETRFKLNGVKVRNVLNKNNAYLGDAASKEIADSVVDGVSDVVGYLSLIASFDGADVQVARNGKAYRLSINLKDLLNGLLNNEDDQTIRNMVETYLPALGLDLKADDLATILPALKLNIDIKLSSKKADTAVITGLAADLSCAKADVKINKKDNKGTLLELVISNDLKVKANLDFKFGDDVTFATDTWESYPAAIGAINLSANGTFEIKNSIENVELLGLLNINIPADTYNLKIELKADPAKLVDMDFTGIHCLPHAISKVISALDVALDLLNLEITKKDGSAFMQAKLEKITVNGEQHVAITALNINALGPNGMVATIVDSLAESQMTLPEVWEMIAGFGLFDNPKVDAGYKLSAESNIAENKYVYVVDVENGYVDANNDGEPDYKDGVLVVGEDYVVVDGRPDSKWNNGYMKNDEDKWIVDVEHGYVDEKNNETGKKEPDGKPDKDSKGNFIVGADFELFQGYIGYENENENGDVEVKYEKIDGRPLSKEYAGYKKVDDKWVVDVENGYVKEGKKEQVVFDSNGNFSVAEGYKLAPVADTTYIGMIWLRPVKEADLTDAQKAYVKAQEDAANKPLIPEAVTKIIDALSIEVKDGHVKVTVAGLSFNYNEDAVKKGEDTELRAISLGATITLDKSGIVIEADLGGKLNEVKINGEPLGLPEKLGVKITINFSDIKYGAIK